MEGLAMNCSFWQGKRVFLTGHTGFKGGWLSLWLQAMGAEVHGFALKPPTTPSFFDVCDLKDDFVSSTLSDIRDVRALEAAMSTAKPEIVFHLAAQPLVQASYENPLETFEVNVMGTANVLDVARRLQGIKAVVIVTTDKCYENKEWEWPYRENDPLGGHDPYSSSKACAELVTQSFRRSFPKPETAIATVRAGNVIGGGDWAPNRLIPDFLRSLDIGQTLVVRNPLSTRPWQHVLEPLSGYLLLAEKLYQQGFRFADAWNFGPDFSDACSVEWIVNRLCASVPKASWKKDSVQQPHEASLLRLDNTKAKINLGWTPRWNIVDALDATLLWHKAWKAGENMRNISLSQIKTYTNKIEEVSSVPV